MKQIKYGDILTVLPNFVTVQFGSVESIAIPGMFDLAWYLLGWYTVILNVAFKSGSSRQGNANRASVGWNLVVSRILLKKKVYYIINVNSLIAKHFSKFFTESS